MSQFLPPYKVPQEHPESCLLSAEGEQGEETNPEEAAVTHPSQTPFIASALPLWKQALLESRESLPEIAMEKECACANVITPGQVPPRDSRSAWFHPAGTAPGRGSGAALPPGQMWGWAGRARTRQARTPEPGATFIYLKLFIIERPKTSGKARAVHRFSNPAGNRAESWNLYPAFERGRPRGEPGPSARGDFSGTGMRPRRSGRDQPVT